MRHFVKTVLLGSAVIALMLPSAVFATSGEKNGQAKMNRPVSVETTDQATVTAFNSNEHSKRVYKTTGVVKSISASAIVVTAKSGTDYAFAIDAKTRMIRKYKGKSSLAEIAVGDHVKVWSNLKNGGTARMIWDKDIWAVRFPGTISNLDTVNKTLTLTIRWKMFDVTSTVKWDDTLVIKQGDVTKTVADLANGQTVKVYGSWNDLGKFIFAKKIKLAE